MAIYDVNGEIITNASDGNDELQAIIASSGYNTYTSGGAGQAIAYKKNLTFAVISDIHGTGDSFSNFVEYINEKKSYLDFIICLGDNVAIGGNEDTTWYDTALNNSEVPCYAVVGNHDIRGVNLSVALTKLFATPKSKGWMAQADFGSSSNGYWYKDFSDYSIRVIGLMEYDNADLLKGNGTYSEHKWFDTAQLQWFADTLYSTPSNYSVVVFTHQPLRKTDMTVIESPFSKAGTFTTDAASAIDGEPIGEILNAFMTATSISKTYSPVSSMASLIDKTAVVSKDFSSRGTGKFACHICGHTHASRLVYDNTYNSIKTVLVPSGSHDIYQRQWDDIRFDGGVGSNNFYVVSIETSKKAVNLVKVGSHETVEMTERFAGKMAY